jgi:carboxymethylenebutenolidase
MCFDHDAAPPELPDDLRRAPLGGGAPGERLELVSADGTAFSGFLALPDDGGDRAGVVIVPDVRGHYPFYEQLADRFAEAGHAAITFDPFGRSAGLGPRDDEFDFWPHVGATTPEGVQADIAASAAELLTRAGARPVVVIGFCFGGLEAFLAATSAELEPVLAGAVGFYGGLDGTRLGAPSPKEHADQTRIPVFGLFGGADEAIPEADREEFRRGLEASGAEHELVVYPGAPHSFFDRQAATFADASEDAWRRTLAFLAAR